MSDKKYSAKELAEIVAKRKKISLGLAESLIDSLTSNISRGLNTDGSVTVTGLGKFRLKRIDSREGKNPATGETITIPAHNRVSYLPGKSLREFINRDFENRKPEKLQPSKPNPVSEPIKVFDDTKPETTERKKPEIKSEPPVNETRQRVNWWKYAAILLIFLTIISHFDLLLPGGNEKSVEDSQTQQASLTSSDASNIDNQNTKEKSAQNVNPNRPVIKEGSHSIHVLQSGENLYYLSIKYYGTAHLWPLIYTHNKEKIDDFRNLRPGIELKIPKAAGFPENTDPQIVDEITEGYIQVYSLMKNNNDEDAVDYLWVAQNIDCGDTFGDYQPDIPQEDLKNIEDMTGSPLFKLCPG